MVLLNKNYEQTKGLCQCLLNEANRKRIHHASVNISVTASIGFCAYPLLQTKPDWFSWEESLKLVDKLLYFAKEGGRNSFVGLSLSDIHHAEILSNSKVRESLLNGNIDDLEKLKYVNLDVYSARRVQDKSEKESNTTVYL